MKLLRHHTPVFGLSWLAIHPLDEDSPMRGKAAADLEALDAEIIVSFTGVDDTLQQNVYRQHSYVNAEIEWNAVFEDIFLPGPDGQLFMDYQRFHRLKKLSPSDPAYVGSKENV
jgi:Inward rectifier potassium channel.